MRVRIGQGIDIHPIAHGRKLFLGGVEIPAPFGLEGHSDADVLLHAVTDAILGACGKGDIGSFFPNSDPQWKNASSTIFLQRAVEEARAAGWRVGNLDITLLAEKPKILPFIPKMKECICSIVAVDVADCAIKATTTERLGFVGREEGMMASAVVLLVSLHA